VKKFLICVTTLYIFLIIVLPLGYLLAQGFAQGSGPWLKGLLREETGQALFLSVSLVLLALPFNALFGLAAAWALAYFSFPGKKLFQSLLDLPLTISPVVTGLMLILAYGQNSPIGAFFQNLGLRIIFNVPGLFLATLFVTYPFVAKEILPVMIEQGKSEEESALLLGASPLRVFWKITLPKVKWGLFYGLLLSSARAAGEYGAASVVSGLLRGKTVTLPIQVQIYFSEYQSIPSYSAAWYFFLLAIISLVLKKLLENKKGEPYGSGH